MASYTKIVKVERRANIGRAERNGSLLTISKCEFYNLQIYLQMLCRDASYLKDNKVGLKIVIFGHKKSRDRGDFSTIATLSRHYLQYKGSI